MARYTVDQYVVAKARDKLKLTDDIMGTKGMPWLLSPILPYPPDSVLQAADVISMLKNNFGLLMETSTKTFDCVGLDKSYFIEFIYFRRTGNWRSSSGRRQTAAGSHWRRIP